MKILSVKIVLLLACIVPIGFSCTACRFNLAIECDGGSAKWQADDLGQSGW